MTEVSLHFARRKSVVVSAHTPRASKQRTQESNAHPFQPPGFFTFAHKGLWPVVSRTIWFLLTSFRPPLQRAPPSGPCCPDRPAHDDMCVLSCAWPQPKQGRRVRTHLVLVCRHNATPFVFLHFSRMARARLGTHTVLRTCGCRCVSNVRVTRTEPHRAENNNTRTRAK